MSGFPQERVTPVPMRLPANPGQAPGRTAAEATPPQGDGGWGAHTA